MPPVFCAADFRSTSELVKVLKLIAFGITERIVLEL